MLDSILTDNPSKLYSYLRNCKKAKTSNIDKLKVGDKVYEGDRVGDGFFDSMSSLKSYDLDFPLLQSKTYTQKGLLTKRLNALEASAEDFSQASEEDTALTMKRKAGVFLDKVASVDLRKNQLEQAFDKLIEHTYELVESDFSPPTPPQVMGEYLEKEMAGLLSKAELALANQEDWIIEAEKVMSQKDPAPSLPPAPASASEQPSIPPTSTTAMFRPYPELKPSLLEKETSYQEVVHFTQVWESYIVAGYGSRRNIPQEMVHIQLQPFINASWWATLLEMGIKKKTFEEIPEAIKAVANLHITLHDRRLDFLKSKRGNMAHSEFLMLLEQKIDQTSYKEWTRDQMCATLFLTYADVEMSKVVTSLINKDKLNMVELRAQIRALEATPWYKGTRD